MCSEEGECHEAPISSLEPQSVLSPYLKTCLLEKGKTESIKNI